MICKAYLDVLWIQTWHIYSEMWPKLADVSIKAVVSLIKLQSILPSCYYNQQVFTSQSWLNSFLPSSHRPNTAFVRTGYSCSTSMLRKKQLTRQEASILKPLELHHEARIFGVCSIPYSSLCLAGQSLQRRRLQPIQAECDFNRVEMCCCTRGRSVPQRLERGQWSRTVQLLYWQ